MTPKRPGRITFAWLILVPLVLALLVVGLGLLARRGSSPSAAIPTPIEHATSLPLDGRGSPSAAAPTQTEPAISPPLATAPATQPLSPTIPRVGHIFEIVMENKSYPSIIGSSSAPYINSLAQQYGLATNFYAIRHPSLPNYLALTSGSTHGVTSDCTNCFVDAPNLADQIESAGKTWRAYMEGMPKPCFVGDQGRYRQKHNPFIYYDSIRKNPARCSNIVPFTQFAQDLAANALPDYVWITPDMCNDMHDCAIEDGDAWLQTWVTKILASPAWQQNGVLFITFDESFASDTSGCCEVAKGGHIVTLVISPLGKPAYQSTIAYDHYSLLGTIEELWDLPKLEGAACACAPPMVDFFTMAPSGLQP